MVERAGNNAIVLRRGELAAFLRSRRERITPEDVGLPGGQRRRTAAGDPAGGAQAEAEKRLGLRW